MKNLTKEQAQWLIEKLQKDLLHKNVSYGDLRQVINKCTEKDLDFTVETFAHDDGKIIIKFDRKDNSVNISVSDLTYGGLDEDEAEYETVSQWVHKDELKKLLDGLNAIWEYIDAKA